jgi:hypothetical protein
VGEVRIDPGWYMFHTDVMAPCTCGAGGGTLQRHRGQTVKRLRAAASRDRAACSCERSPGIPMPRGPRQ